MAEGRRCEECGTSIEGTHPQRVYCGTRCRLIRWKADRGAVRPEIGRPCSNPECSGTIAPWRRTDKLYCCDDFQKTVEHKRYNDMRSRSLAVYRYMETHAPKALEKILSQVAP